MIHNEVFDQLYRLQLGDTCLRGDRETINRRFNRARLALQARNYFFGCNYVPTTGATGETAIVNTLPVNQSVVIRGAGLNAQTFGVDTEIGRVETTIFRSGNSRTQILRALGLIPSAHLTSNGQGQQYELDWPAPLVLDPNEVLQVRWRQLTPTAAGSVYALMFYGVNVQPQIRCQPEVLNDVRRQIESTCQRPGYLNLKTEDSGGAVHYPTGAGAEQTVELQTQALDDHILVLGFRRNNSRYLENGNSLANTTTFRLIASDGHGFSRELLALRGWEYFCAPDAGYFRFTLPHLLLRGETLAAQIKATPDTALEQFAGELNLLYVTV